MSISGTLETKLAINAFPDKLLSVEVVEDGQAKISNHIVEEVIEKIVPSKLPEITHTDQLDAFFEDMSSEFSKRVTLQTQTQTATTHHNSSWSHVQQTCTDNSNLLSARDIVIAFLQQDLTQLSIEIPEHVVKAIQLLDNYFAEKSPCTEKTSSSFLSRIQTILNSAIEVKKIIQSSQLVIERESELKKTLMIYIEEGNKIKATYATCVANADKIRVKIKDLEEQLIQLKKQLVSEENLVDDLNIKRASILEKAISTKTEWKSVFEKLEQVKIEISTKTCVSEANLRTWKELGLKLQLLSSVRSTLYVRERIFI